MPSIRNTGIMIPENSSVNVTAPSNNKLALLKVERGSKKRKSGNPAIEENNIPQKINGEIFARKKFFFKLLKEPAS